MTIARHRPQYFTGLHLAAIVVGFFTVVVMVNATMATLASRTFTGAIVRNGYVANQDFDDWSAAGERQAALGWTVAARIDEGALVVEARDRAGAAISAALVTATLRHPIAADRSVTLRLSPSAAGIYAAPVHLPRGQWDALIRLKAQGRDFRLRERLYHEG